MKNYSKIPGLIWAAIVLATFARAAETPALSPVAGENDAQKKPSSSPPLDAKITALSQRLNAQIDAQASVVRNERMPPTGSGDIADLRPLYVRRHGISAGTRVEWVPVPDQVEEPIPPPPDVQEYLTAAAAGDRRAMSVLGAIYHQGEDVPQNYAAAHDWYVRAAAKGDGDAINNLGVLYRDGLGVRANRKIAYLVFLAGFRSGQGNEQTRLRAQRNLDRLAQELPPQEIHEALSYTWTYVQQVMKSRGRDFRITPEVLPAADRPRIRDNGWWNESERAAMTFPSPPPWDTVNNP